MRINTYVKSVQQRYKYILWDVSLWETNLQNIQNKWAYYAHIYLHTNKTSNVSIAQRWGSFVQPLLHWKSKKYYIRWVCIFSLSQQAMRKCYIVTCTLSDYNIFSTLFHERHDFRRKKLLITKCAFWFTLQLCLKDFSFQEEFGEKLS
jgi:hypothetical protein